MMLQIKHIPIKESVSVYTESKISELLNRDRMLINSDYVYADVLLASSIKNNGIEYTQRIINSFKRKSFFVCQHIFVDKLDFGNHLVFTPHSTFSDNYVTIPHYTVVSNNKKNIKNKKLFSFMGSTTTHSVRKKLVELYPNFCIDSKHHWGLDKSLKSEIKNDIQYKYIESINNSIFCLCPRGTGVSTIRLFESMSMGCIPVIISDNYQPPLIDFLNWDEFSVTVAEKDIDKIEIILNNISMKEIVKMRKKVIEVYENWFDNKNLHKTIIKKINTK